MKETGIFYGTSSGKTEEIAMRIHQRLGEEITRIQDIVESSAEDLMSYRSLILGIPTWGIGELQEDWLDFLPALGGLDMSGTRAALFGLGDQESYPDTFANALGTLYDSLLQAGCQVIGQCHPEGYEFTKSKALREGMFVGLVLDEENQSHLTDARIDNWLNGILPVLRQT